jgi:hypothetical protein
MVSEVIDGGIKPFLLWVQSSLSLDALLDLSNLLWFSFDHLLVDGASTLVHESFSNEGRTYESECE